MPGRDSMASVNTCAPRRRASAAGMASSKNIHTWSRFSGDVDRHYRETEGGAEPESAAEVGHPLPTPPQSFFRRGDSLALGGLSQEVGDDNSQREAVSLC